MNFQTPGLKKKELQLQWVNGIVHMHDMICKCNDPLEHAVDAIFDQEKHLRLTQSTQEKIKRCLTGGAEDTQGGADANIEEGDLTALFAEPFTEEDTG